MKLSESEILVPILLLAGAVLTAGLVVQLAGLPQAVRVLVPAGVALLTAFALFQRAAVGERADAARADDRVSNAEARLADLTKRAAQLRHDLRGILSPAMLTADRLSGSQDPIARRAGEAMVSTVERAEERLRQEQVADRKIDLD